MDGVSLIKNFPDPLYPPPEGAPIRIVTGEGIPRKRLRAYPGLTGEASRTLVYQRLDGSKGSCLSRDHGRIPYNGVPSKQFSASNSTVVSTANPLEFTNFYSQGVRDETEISLPVHYPAPNHTQTGHPLPGPAISGQSQVSNDIRQDRQDSRDRCSRASTRRTALTDTRERHDRAATQLPFPSEYGNCFPPPSCEGPTSRHLASFRIPALLPSPTCIGMADARWGPTWPPGLAPGAGRHCIENRWPRLADVSGECREETRSTGCGSRPGSEL